MRLEGSCHCGKVKFQLESKEPWPFARCYCGICRKTTGGGGYAINLGGDTSTLEVQGREHLKEYRAMLQSADGKAPSEHARFFCGECGSHVYAIHDRWPELVHPVATAIDTPLPKPPASIHLMVGSKAPWVEIEGKPGDEQFELYPDKSLADWHAAHGYEE